MTKLSETKIPKEEKENIKGMLKYWDEVSGKDPEVQSDIFRDELYYFSGILSPKLILACVARELEKDD